MRGLRPPRAACPSATTVEGYGRARRTPGTDQRPCQAGPSGPEDRRRSLSRAPQGARHRLAVRQRRHRLRAAHRSPGPRRRGRARDAASGRVRTRTPRSAMAHGYYLITGQPQAVMVHVNVGTANALMGLLNAARDNVPVFFLGAHAARRTARSAAAICRSTGARRCTTRPGCCASTSSGTTSCATASRWRRSSTGRS